MGRIGQGIARRGAHGFGMKVLYHNRSRLPADRGVAPRDLCGPGYTAGTVRPSGNGAALHAGLASHHRRSCAGEDEADGNPGEHRPRRHRRRTGAGRRTGQRPPGGRWPGCVRGRAEGAPELLALRNVVLTPHIGSASLATRTAMVQLAVDNLAAGLGLDGGPSRMPSAINADAAMAARVMLGKTGNDREPPRAPLEEVPRTQLSCVFSPFPFS